MRTDVTQANFTPSIPNGTHPKVDSINGATAPVAVEDAGGESELDFQLAYPIVYPIEVVLYQDVCVSSKAMQSGYNTDFCCRTLDMLKASSMHWMDLTAHSMLSMTLALFQLSSP